MMTPDRLFLIPLALGHLALFVLTVNVVHALGHREELMDKVKIILLASFAAASALMAWEAWNGSILAWSWPSLIYGSVCILNGLILFPASTAFLHHRPRPDGIKERETLLDLSAAEGAESLIGQGKYAWILKIPGNQSFKLRKLECEVTLPALPPSLNGLSIVHLSDMHLARSFDRRFFEAVVEEAAAWHSDLVLFTGDLVDDPGAVDWIEPLFSRLRGRLGSFAILGNHDLPHDPKNLSRLLERAGFQNLEGSWATVEQGTSTIAIGGTSYPWGPPLPIAQRPQADLKILLSHAPDRFYWAESEGFDLMLSGHNHGGQVRLPLVGPVFMPSIYSRRFDRGFFRCRGLTLHVSQGVAGKHPYRFGCYPEICRLVLRSELVEPSSTSRPHAHNARAATP